MMEIRWDVIWNYRFMFLNGLWMTVYVTIVGIFFGMFLGLLLGIAKISKPVWLRWPAVAYIDFFRGTPLFVQILLFHYAVMPTLFGSKDAVLNGIVVLAMNSAAYIAEIFRAGIQSIERGQMEAARSLGMTHLQAMIYVILPQAVKRMIPPLGNEFIVLLKDSSLLAAIAVAELANAGRLTAMGTYRPWEAYLTVAFLYLALTLVFTRILHYVERRLNRDQRA